MLTLVRSPAAYIRIRASGRLTGADYRRFEHEFAAELKGREVPTLPLLLDIRGFDLRPSSIPRLDARRIAARPRVGSPQPPRLFENRRGRRRGLAPLDHHRRKAMNQSPYPWPDCPRQS